MATYETEIWIDDIQTRDDVAKSLDGVLTLVLVVDIQGKYTVLEKVPKDVQGKYSVKIIKDINGKWSYPYLVLSVFKLQDATISKSIQDKLWNCAVSLDEFYDISLTGMPKVVYSALDHLDVSHILFVGIMPESSPEGAAAANKTYLIGKDYGWYLANQYVPSAYYHNTAGTNPATIITALLGGANWLTTTGIEPYNINTVTQWGDTLASRVFDFDGKTTKQQAIDKICEYCRYMFIVKWQDNGDGYYQSTGYFIDENDIDTELDLPAAVTITAPDPYLEGKIKIARRATERYNQITVTGRDPDGTVFTKTLSSPGLTAGDELPVEYIENSGAWTTQLQVDARCLELYNYYINTTTVYTATFINRVDLVLYQKIKFVGYTAYGIPEDWGRITSIQYSTTGAGKRVVRIEFTTDQGFSNITRMYRSNSPDFVTETESIFDGKMAQVAVNEVGTVTSIDGNTAEVLLEDGRTVTARIII
jgi:hypothetical protein